MSDTRLKYEFIISEDVVITITEDTFEKAAMRLIGMLRQEPKPSQEPEDLNTITPPYETLP